MFHRNRQAAAHRHRNRRLILEQLDSRQLMAADAMVAWDALQSQPLIGESVDVSLQFSNAGDSAGYGPYVDVIIPSGAENSGGLEYVLQSGRLLDAGLRETVVTFDADGQAKHPIARDEAGLPLTFKGNPNDQLVIFELPFGSFTPDQPALKVDLQLSVDADADFGQSMGLVANSGFRYGNDSVDNIGDDPMVRGKAVQLDVTPGLVTTQIEYIGTENETAMGANYVRSYRVSFDVAEGAMINELTLRTQLDSSATLVGIRDADTRQGDFKLEKSFASDGETQGTEIHLSADQWKGVAGEDGSFIVDFYIPTTEQTSSSITSKASGNYIETQASETTEANLVSFESVSSMHDLEHEWIAVQQSVRLASDANVPGFGPGDTAEYTVNFQVADDAILDDATISFTVPDGQSLESIGNLTFVGLEQGEGDAITLKVEAYEYGPVPLGSHTYHVNLAKALDKAGFSSRIVGGTADERLGGSVTGSFTYRAIVLDKFMGKVESGDISVDEGDLFLSSAVASAYRVQNVSGESFYHKVTDNSGTRTALQTSSVATSVYAINGETDFSTTAVMAGDEVTFRVTREVRSSDIEELKLTGFLPMPVFAVGELQWSDQGGDKVNVNQIQWGERDTFHKLLKKTPEVRTDKLNNQWSLDFGSVDWDVNETRTIEVLVTVAVADQPFADGMWLTHLANSSQGSSNNGQHSSNAMTAVQYARPVLTIRKDVAGSDNSRAIRSKNSAGGWDIRGVDADDIVQMESVIQNVGSGVDGAYQVVLRDMIPDGFAVPNTGLQLEIVDGNGKSLEWKGRETGNPRDLFGFGIELVDPIASSQDSSASDRVIVRYQLQVADAAIANTTHATNASVIHYTAVPDGVNYVTSPINDDAQISISGGGIQHVSIATDQSHTSSNYVAIGETVTYRAIVQVPEGWTRDATLRLDSPTGMAFNEVISVQASSELKFDDIDAKDMLDRVEIGSSNNNVRSGGNRMTLKIGDLSNPTSSNDDVETIEIVYTATVTDDPGNDAGDNRRPVARWIHANGSTSKSSNSVKIVDAGQQVQKQWQQHTADAGDRVTAWLDVTSPGAWSTSGFEVSVTDQLPAGTRYVEGSLKFVSGEKPETMSVKDGILTATWNSLTASSRLAYDVLVDESIQPGQQLDSESTITWTSLPGTPGQIAKSNDLAHERAGRFTSNVTLPISAATLAGRVFMDANQNGIEEFGDRGIGSVTVTIIGEDYLGNVVERSTTTLPTGHYEFANLRGGTYQIVQSQPENVPDGQDYVGVNGGRLGDDRIENIHIPRGSNDVVGGYLFTESTLTWIEGTVFFDENQDSILGKDEAGISNIEITLTGQTNDGVEIHRTTTTNDRGHYVFGHLEPGKYDLKQGETIDYFDAGEQLGTAGGQMLDDAFSGITITSSRPGRMYNFGEYKPASLSGHVFIDYDRDNLLDRKDGLIAGVEVQLVGVNDRGEEISQSTKTDVNGSYQFTSLRPGEYKIESFAVEGLDVGITNAGMFQGTFASSTGNGVASKLAVDQIKLPAGAIALDYDFGHVDPNYDPSIHETQFDSQVTFNGTGGSDHFEVAFSSDGAVITVGDESYRLDASQTRSVRILGGGGQDSLTFTGSENKETINLRETSADITGTWFESLIYSMESVHFIGGGNEDLARFYDTTGDDRFDAEAFQATLSGEGYEHSVEQVHRIYAYMTEGVDAVNLTGRRDDNDTVNATPDRARMYGSDFYLYANGYDSIVVTATDETDRMDLYASAGDDHLTYRGPDVSLVGEGFSIVGNGYRLVNVSATQGGNDSADLQGSSGDDAFRSRPTQAILESDGFRLSARGFETVEVTASGGNDTARFHDTHYGDVFTADAKTAQIQNSVNETTAIGFERVYAYMEAGGNDVATIRGSSSADTFKASPEKWTMEGGGSYLYGIGFTSVTAYGNANDTAYLYDSAFDDTLDLRAGRATMSGQRFSNTAIAFGKINSEASQGNDRVAFHDTSARSTVRFNESKTTVFGSGFSYNATGFDAVDAYYADLGGRDNVEFDGRIDFDLLAVDVNDAKYKLSLSINENTERSTIKSDVRRLL